MAGRRGSALVEGAAAFQAAGATAAGGAVGPDGGPQEHAHRAGGSEEVPGAHEYALGPRSQGLRAVLSGILWNSRRRSLKDMEI